MGNVTWQSALAPKPPFLFDASRLIWRLWRRRLPTGIDRVCLAYLNEFAPEALALLQWREHRVVLGFRHSQALFALLNDGAAQGLNRAGLIALLARAIPMALIRPPAIAGAIYLNVGHTGLDIASLPSWLDGQGLRAVYLVHDLIPITHPQYCRAGEAEKHTRRMRHALSSAAGFVANSAATRDDLASFAHDNHLPLAPVLVAHLGVEPLPAPPLPRPHERPYFLCIGTIEARKNHLLLLDLWDQLRGEPGPDVPDLVLVGQRGWEAEDVFARLDAVPLDRGKVIELGQCDDAALAAWIDHARALLLPSKVEGFGLPMIEALARGTPVIAADLPVYREIAGANPLLLDPQNKSAWLAAVQDYLGDSAERAQQVCALATFNPPRWPAHMAQVRKWLKAL